MEPSLPSADGWIKPRASRSSIRDGCRSTTGLRVHTDSSPPTRSFDRPLPVHDRDDRRRADGPRLGVGHLQHLADDLADPGRWEEGILLGLLFWILHRPAGRHTRRAAPRLRRPDLPPAVHHRGDGARRPGRRWLGGDDLDPRRPRAPRGALVRHPRQPLGLGFLGGPRPGSSTQPSGTARSGPSPISRRPPSSGDRPGHVRPVGLSALLATGHDHPSRWPDIARGRPSAGHLLPATAASEVILGWVLVVAYGTVGWWAALVCAALVLVIWQAHIDRERAATTR